MSSHELFALFLQQELVLLHVRQVGLDNMTSKLLTLEQLPELVNFVPKARFLVKTTMK